MENEEKVRKMMKKQGKSNGKRWKREENYEKAKKNTGKRGKREEKWRKTNEKPRKSQGKSEETVCPRPKKNKIPKTRKKNPQKIPHPNWSAQYPKTIGFSQEASRSDNNWMIFGGPCRSLWMFGMDAAKHSTAKPHQLQLPFQRLWRWKSCEDERVSHSDFCVYHFYHFVPWYSMVFNIYWPWISNNTAHNLWQREEVQALTIQNRW